MIMVLYNRHENMEKALINQLKVISEQLCFRISKKYLKFNQINVIKK